MLMHVLSNQHDSNKIIQEVLQDLVTTNTAITSSTALYIGYCKFTLYLSTLWLRLELEGHQCRYCAQQVLPQLHAMH